jgi:hypothetical protein
MHKICQLSMALNINASIDWLTTLLNFKENCVIWPFCTKVSKFSQISKKTCPNSLPNLPNPRINYIFPITDHGARHFVQNIHSEWNSAL